MIYAIVRVYNQRINAREYTVQFCLRNRLYTEFFKEDIRCILQYTLHFTPSHKSYVQFLFIHISVCNFHFSKECVIYHLAHTISTYKKLIQFPKIFVFLKIFFVELLLFSLFFLLFYVSMFSSRSHSVARIRFPYHMVFLPRHVDTWETEWMKYHILSPTQDLV